METKELATNVSMGVALEQLTQRPPHTMSCTESFKHTVLCEFSTVFDVLGHKINCHSPNKRRFGAQIVGDGTSLADFNPVAFAGSENNPLYV